MTESTDPEWETPLRERLPGLVDLAELRLDGPELAWWLHDADGALVRDWFRRRGASFVGDILALRGVDIMAWRGIGAGKYERIMAVLTEIDASAAAISDATDEEPGPRYAEDLPSEAELLIQWARVIHHAETWRELLSAVSQEVLPPDVAAASRDLREQTLPLVATTDPMKFLREWFESLDSREQAIWRSRVLRLEPMTLDELGLRSGVTRERVRQIEARLVSRVRAMLDLEPSWQPVRWAAFALAQQLGALAPVVALNLSETGDEGTDLHTLRWLAGYSIDGSRIVRDGFQLPDLEDVPFDEEGPVVEVAELVHLLSEAGVRDRFMDFAVDSIPGLGRVNDVLVRWPRNVVDRAYAVLAVAGKPMTPNEIYIALGESGSEQSLRNRLFEDERLVRVSRHSVGLRAWGGVEYTGIVDLMRKLLEEEGEMSLADLAEDLAYQFDVSPASVSMYSAAPTFVVSEGVIRLRQADEPFEPRSKPQLVAGLFQTSPNALTWNLKVDSDLMRGSGRSIAPEIATFLGSRPGVRLVLQNSVKEVPLNWLETSHVGPHLGSLKSQIEAIGAESGDVVQITFDRTRLSIEVALRPSANAREGAVHAVARLTGLRMLTADPVALAKSIHVTVSEVESVLRRRGDDEVADAWLGLMRSAEQR